LTRAIETNINNAGRRDNRRPVVVVQELREKFKAGKMMLGLETMQFLRSWLVDHIQGMDKAYGPHLRANGIH